MPIVARESALPGPDLEIRDSAAYRLPVQPTPFIGRENKVEVGLRASAQRRVRLLTLTGPGGTGKTRLGIEVAGQLLDDFHAEVYFVGLAAITDPPLVITSIAQALGVMEFGQQGAPRERQVLLARQACAAFPRQFRAGA